MAVEPKRDIVHCPLAGFEVSFLTIHVTGDSNEQSGRIVYRMALLTIVFLSHTVVLLVFEPAMGFNEFSDFFDQEMSVPA